MKVSLEISASGFYEMEVDDEVLKDLLNTEGDIDEEALSELPCLLQHFGLDKFAKLDALVDGEELLNAIDISIEDIVVVPQDPLETAKGKA